MSITVLSKDALNLHCDFVQYGESNQHQGLPPNKIKRFACVTTLQVHQQDHLNFFLEQQYHLGAISQVVTPSQTTSKILHRLNQPVRTFCLCKLQVHFYYKCCWLQFYLSRFSYKPSHFSEQTRNLKLHIFTRNWQIRDHLSSNESSLEHFLT